MQGAGLEGVPASPKGLRHGFGVAAVTAGIPLNLVQKWLGHAQLSTTRRLCQCRRRGGEGHRSAHVGLSAAVPNTQAGHGYHAIVKKLGISRSSVYRLIGQ